MKTSNHLPSHPAVQASRPRQRNPVVQASSLPQRKLIRLLTGLAIAALTAPGWPAQAGLVTEPALSAPAGRAIVQPVGFRIDPGPTGQLSPRTHPGNAAPQPGNNSAVNAQGQNAFVHVTMPKQSLYVGELVPVQVKAYFRAGMAASLTGLPLLGSDAFSLGKIGDHPAQSQEIIDGQPFTVLTWDTTLSGVKAGDYPLNIDLPATIRVREKGRRGAPNPFKDFFGDNSPFGDSSFFDNFFSSFSEKEITLHTDGAVVNVEAQPLKGRPANFSGAVGDFDVTSEAPSTTASVGEPFTLKIKVSGKGNFDRVNITGVARTADWKAYRPSAKFAPGDANGFSGEKTFEQVVTPSKAGAQQIPSLSFSYFDPSDGHYVTKNTQPISLDVAAAAPGAAPSSVDSAAAGVTTTPPANVDQQALRVRQSPIASLHPLVLRPWFIAANALLLIAVALGALARRMALRRSHNPKRLAREAAERSVQASLASMEDAEKRGDGAGFFVAARQALQERLAAVWRIPPNAVTGPLITERLNGDGESLRAIFRAADEVSYSHRAYSSAELRRWHETFTKQIHRIETL
jgi:BatD DUF11 like domain